MQNVNADVTVEENGKYYLICAVRFHSAGSLYHFLVKPELNLGEDDWVVVETVHGSKVGQIVEIGCDLPSGFNVNDLKSVLRRASGLDMARRQMLAKRAERLRETAQEEMKALKQKEVKAVDAEYTLDGDKALIFYRGNLSSQQHNDLRNRLSGKMNCNVELHSVGPRDEAKLLGGYGVCGERRCCARFLTDFTPISIHMAKDQAISLAPTDITGMCGRLRCCLNYEHEVYKEASKGFPRRKARVQTEHGLGRVIDWDVLKQEIVVEIPPTGPRRDRKRYRFKPDDLEVVKRKKK
jgi:cell fate regulator YaaT (PSP1 superfamily)